MPTLVGTGQITIIDVNDGDVSNLTPPSELTPTIASTMGGWTTYVGTLSNSSIIDTAGPNGEYTRVVRIVGAGTAPGWIGGWKHSFKTDVTKPYVTYIWVRRRTTNSSNLYIGWTQAANYINDLGGANNADPQFISAFNPPTANKWYLSIGVIWPSTYSGADTGYAGMYDPESGARVYDGAEFKHNSAVPTDHYLRFAYYNASVAQTSSDGFDFLPVGTYVMDGTHPTKEAILNSIRGYGYTGDLNATYGASFTAGGTGNITGQITNTNVGTFIAEAAIGSAQIGSIALVGTNNFSVKTSTNSSTSRIEMDSQVIKIFEGSTLRVKIGNLAA